MHKYHILYKTTCTINNTFYIGIHSTNNLEDGYLGSGVRLINSVRKYGRDKHSREILGFYEDRDSLGLAESQVVNKELLENEFCINIVEGGGNVGIGIYIGNLHKDRLFSDEEYRSRHNLKSSECLKKLHREGKLNTRRFLGKTHSEESKELIGSSAKLTSRGERNSQFGTCGIYNKDGNKKIHKSELESYIKLGWIKGRRNVGFIA